MSRAFSAANALRASASVSRASIRFLNSRMVADSTEVLPNERPVERVVLDEPADFFFGGGVSFNSPIRIVKFDADPGDFPHRRNPSIEPAKIKTP